MFQQIRGRVVFLVIWFLLLPIEEASGDMGQQQMPELPHLPKRGRLGKGKSPLLSALSHGTHTYSYIYYIYLCIYLYLDLSWRSLPSVEKERRPRFGLETWDVGPSLPNMLQEAPRGRRVASSFVIKTARMRQGNQNQLDILGKNTKRKVRNLCGNSK